MTLAISQEQQYLGHDFWRWRAWISGETADLNQVREVQWFLHPSFSPSEVTTQDRSTGFQLERRGWGTFTLRAELHRSDGEVLTLRQRLRLYYPADQGEAAARSPQPRSPGVGPFVSAPEKGPIQAPQKRVPKIFLSYGFSDRPTAATILVGLQRLGFTVIDGPSIGRDQPEFATLELLGSADGTVAWLSGDIPSVFVAQELNASVRAGKPTLVLTSQQPGSGSIPGVPREVQIIQVDPTDTSKLAAAVRPIIQT